MGALCCGPASRGISMSEGESTRNATIHLRQSSAKHRTVKLDEFGGKLVNSKQDMLQVLDKEEAEKLIGQLDVGLNSTYSSEDITKVYTFGKRLGEGFVGQVRSATLNKNPNFLYAVKSIKKKELKKANARYVKKEIDIIKETDCSYIIQFYECYEDQNFIHIVLEYCEGGDLVTLVENRRGLSEGLAKRYFWQAAVAINYLHHFGIIHRDIKLDNFLLSNNPPEEADLKLSDFGFATEYKKEKPKSMVGTPYYVAPEILEQNYSKECDIWSLGVMLYMMVFAEPPFKGANNKAIFDQVKNKELNFQASSKLNNSDPELQKLLYKLLKKDPEKRCTLTEALQSPWLQPAFTDYASRWNTYLKKDILLAMKDITSYTAFQRQIIKLVVRTNLETFEVVIRSKIFALLDYKNTGVIDKHELFRVFKDYEIESSLEECSNIIEKACLGTEEIITFTEFVAATADPKLFFSEEFLQPVFNRIDIDNSKTISMENIEHCFRRFGYQLSSKVLAIIRQELDLDTKETLTFEEFKKMLANKL